MPYERLPIATRLGDPKNDRAVDAAGCTTTATTTSDRIDTRASCQRYSERSVRCAVAKKHTSNAVAARPAALSLTPAGLDAAARMRHGRHRNAAPAPSSRPLERVNVDRYKKLVRSDVNAVGDARKNVMSITTNAAISTDRPMSEMRLLRRVIATKTSGQIRYHCSSTARLHRCRSGEKLPKYCVPPRICPQFAK